MKANRKAKLNTSMEMKLNPSMREQLIGHQKLSDRNEAQNLNIYDYIDRWGNKRHLLSGKTKIGSRIARIKPIHFGSLACYWTDSMPMGVKFIKGQDKMVIKQDHHFSRGRAILNRRALSKMLASWSYIYDVRYWSGYSSNTNVNRSETAIGIWCIREEINGQEYDLISGVEAIKILNDIIYAVRNAYPNAWYEFRMQVNNPDEANEVVVVTEEFNAMGKLISRSEKIKYFCRWRFPKYNIEYLQGLIDELNSGNYYTDLYVPIIHDLFKYPIKCNDTHEKLYLRDYDEDGQVLDSAFNKAKTEYEEQVRNNYQYS